jgi:hypothetical protein
VVLEPTHKTACPRKLGLRSFRHSISASSTSAAKLTGNNLGQQSRFLLAAVAQRQPTTRYRRAYRFVSRLVYSTTAIISISTIASG